MRKKTGPEISESKTLMRKLFVVALPIAAQNLISASLTLVDTLMVGSLGETELATVGLATQIFFIFWMILFGFTGGTITYMAQFWGKRDMVNIRRVVGIAVTVCFGVGLVFFFGCVIFPEKVLGIFTNIPEVLAMGKNWVRLGAVIFLPWSIVVPLSASLKATQQTSIPLKISIVVFSTNTILGIILIFGFLGAPQMGIMGACTATVVSRILEFLLYIYVVFARKNIVSGPLGEFFSWNKALFRRVIANAIPTTINEAMWGLGTSMYNAAYGRMGVTAFAAIQAGNSIQNIFALACFSIGDAMLILVGEKLGAGELENAKKTAAKILKFATIIGICAGLLLFLSSRFIVRLFDLTGTGVHYAILILIIFSIFMPFKIFNSTIITGVLRAGGDTKFAMLSETAIVWLIGVPIAFIGALYLQLPIYLVVLMVQIEEFTKFFVMTYRYRSLKWLKNLVSNIK